MVLAVLVHDRQTLDAAVLASRLGDVDDAGVEVTGLAGESHIYGVGDDVGDAAPVGDDGRVDLPHHVLLGDHVPEPELDPQPIAAVDPDLSLGEGLGSDHPPVGELGKRADGLLDLDEGFGVGRLEQAGSLQIGFDHSRDLPAEFEFLLNGFAVPGALFLNLLAAEEIGHRDGDRLHGTPGDIDPKLAPRRQRNNGQEKDYEDRLDWIH